MKLKEYLKREKLSALVFAKTHNLTQPTISRIINKKHIPRPETAAKIEKATKGQVTRLELLYPDLENREILHLMNRNINRA